MARVLIIASLASSLRNFRGPLLEAFLARGHTVHAAAPELETDTETRAWLEARGVTCHAYPMARSGLSPIGDLRCFLELYRLMRQVRPDLSLGYTMLIVTEN